MKEMEQSEELKYIVILIQMFAIANKKWITTLGLVKPSQDVFNSSAIWGL